MKERLQVICCLDFTEVGCVFACLESLKETFLEKLFNDTFLRKPS